MYTLEEKEWSHRHPHPSSNLHDLGESFGRALQLLLYRERRGRREGVEVPRDHAKRAGERGLPRTMRLPTINQIGRELQYIAIYIWKHDDRESEKRVFR